MSSLRGLLVVALEQAVAAPFCTSRLADAGARVIKIEREGGDFARSYDRAVQGESAYFVWLNRGKESAVLDLTQPDDAALLRRMIAQADIFIENLAPGAAGRLGLDPAALRQAHPRLITCSIAGYGSDGPGRGRKAYDLLIQAETGLASITGSAEAPGRVGVSVADIGAGLNAYAAILEALLARERTGEGRAITITLFDTIAEWMAVPLLHYRYGGQAPARVGLNHPTIAPYGLYPAGDGGEILIAIQNQREWVNFRDRFLDGTPDPRFADNPARVAHRAALDAAITAAFAPYDAHSLRAALDDAGIAYGTLNDVAGLAAHPHLAQRVVDTASGPIALPRPPARTGAAEPDCGPVPSLDAHGAKLRAEFA
jgi:crotonobetainyl-CoA:carnitine CoA-transferase CaiB-like acyl-CoA transferase